MPKPHLAAVILAFASLTLSAGPTDPSGGAARLFADKGAPKGWSVRAWDDLAKEAPADAKWLVDDNGVLHGSDPRGTWLISEKEYGDFVLELDFKIPAHGNSGVALRCPMHGDPAFDGMELQIVDPRYYDGKGDPDQLTGSLYKAVAPAKQAFRPEQWNHYQITCRGSRVKVILNGDAIQDVDLDDQKKQLEKGSPLKDRPRRGHIGFQELSRDGHVQIRNATLQPLDK
ncbi:MAG: hypothetical protein JWO87_3846 [Phycisphaerales bacterium]|nr:hypothetical protein [Phycisphaerales bacterium]